MATLTANMRAALSKKAFKEKEHGLSTDFKEYTSEKRQELAQGLEWLWRSGKYFDCSIIVGESAETGREIKAHAVVLSAGSEPFRAMFCGGYTESQCRKVVIPGYSHEIVQRMVQFLYTGDIEISDTDVIDLFTLADQYGLIELKVLCEQHVSSAISLDSVISLLVSAQHHCANELKQKCLEFFKNNALQILQKPAFKDVPEDLLIEMLKVDFNIPEIKVFECVVEWGKQRMGGITLQKAMQGVVRYIRFVSIKKVHLQRIVLPLEVLPQEIMVDVLFQRIRDPLVVDNESKEEDGMSEEEKRQLYEVKPWLKPRGKIFLRFEDFSSEDEYAEYMKAIVRPGTMLRAVRTYENVQEGDVGEFLQFNAGVPPCCVQWRDYANSYWLYWRDLEIVDA